MKCDRCTQEFIEDENVLSNFLMHMIIKHGETVNNKNVDEVQIFSTKPPTSSYSRKQLEDMK